MNLRTVRSSIVLTTEVSMDRLFPFFLQGSPDNSKEFALAFVLALAVNCVTLAAYALTIFLCFKLVF